MVMSDKGKEHMGLPKHSAVEEASNWVNCASGFLRSIKKRHRKIDISACIAYITGSYINKREQSDLLC